MFTPAARMKVMKCCLTVNLITSFTHVNNTIWSVLLQHISMSHISHYYRTRYCGSPQFQQRLPYCATVIETKCLLGRCVPVKTFKIMTKESHSLATARYNTNTCST